MSEMDDVDELEAKSEIVDNEEHEIIGKWRPGWWQAHGLMMLATLVYATWNCVNRQMGHEGISPVAFVMWRQVGSAAILLSWEGILALKARDQFMPPEVVQNWKRYVALGALMTSFQVLIMVGAAMTSATTVGVFQCLEPSVAAMLGFILGMEDRSLIRRRLLSAITAGVGVTIIMVMREFEQPAASSDDEDAPVWWVYLFGCFILFVEGGMVAVYYLVQTKLLAPPINASPLRVTTWAYCFACPITFMVVSVNIEVYHFEPALNSWAALFEVFMFEVGEGLAPAWGLLYAIFFASIVGYWLWGVANQTLEASEMILYQAVQLPITATISVIFLGESLHWSMLLGAVFIFGALVFKSPTLVKHKCLEPKTDLEVHSELVEMDMGMEADEEEGAVKYSTVGTTNQ